MICQRCQEQPAQVQYTEVVAGAKRVEWLCGRCAGEHGIQIQVAGAEEAAVPQTLIPPTPEGERPALRCPGCGLGLVAFQEGGRMGCPQCYDTFQEALEPLLRRVHHATEHTPQEGVQDAPSRVRRVLATLRRELTESVRREEFERAASLRDELRRYEEELRGLSASGDSPETKLRESGSEEGS